jgi:small-conductance mechanosensitive channel
MEFTALVGLPALPAFGFDLAEIAFRLGATLAVALMAQVALRVVPPVFRGLDDWVDKYKKIDLPKPTHEALESVTRGVITLVALAYVFYFLLAANPLANVVFQVVGLFVVARTLIGSTVPFVQGLDILFSHKDMSRHQRKLFEKAVVYTAYTALLLSWMYVLGLTEFFYALLAGAGFAGIVVGFAAKDTFGNFIAGITVVMDKPFKIGDTIEVRGILGEVDELALRSTTLKMFDNRVVNIPNSILATEPIINYTREKLRRIDIPIAIAYESDLRKAVAAVQAAVMKVDGVVTDGQCVDVTIDRFSDAGIGLTAYFWVDSKKGLGSVKNEALEAIKDALDKEGIELPYPKRVMITRGEKK